MIHILITFGDRCRKIAKPASYKDLIAKARKEFPMMSSVACLVVMFYPKTTDETIPRVKMVELDSNAYGSVKDGEVLFFNVQHPITKEYVLPYPDEDPDVPRQSQYHPADVERMFARSGKEKHVKVSPTSFLHSSRAYQYQDSNVFSLDGQRAGGDAFGSGWGAASDRFWRSAKLVPNLKECKDAVGLAIGESNGYPDDQSADSRTKDARSELQGAFDALATRTPIAAFDGHRSEGVWEGEDAAKQRSQQTENVLAGGAGWASSGTGAGSQGWGHMSASDRREIRPASPRTVGIGPESTSSGTGLAIAFSAVNGSADHRRYNLDETAQMPGHNDPFQTPPVQPGWFTDGRNAPATYNDDENNNNNVHQEVGTTLQSEYAGTDQDVLRSGPEYRPSAAISEWTPQFDYGLPNGQSFQKLVAPGAIGPTYLVSLELREREAAIQQAKQARQPRRMVRVPKPISRHQPSFFDPAKSATGSPATKQPRVQGYASSQWATKEVWHQANTENAQNQTRDSQQQRQLLLDIADHLQRSLDLEHNSGGGIEADSGA